MAKSQDPRTEYGAGAYQSRYSRASGSAAGRSDYDASAWQMAKRLIGRRKRYRSRSGGKTKKMTGRQRMKNLRDYMASDEYAAYMRRKKKERARRQPGSSFTKEEYERAGIRR